MFVFVPSSKGVCMCMAMDVYGCLCVCVCVSVYVSGYGCGRLMATGMGVVAVVGWRRMERVVETGCCLCVWVVDGRMGETHGCACTHTLPPYPST